MGNPNSSFIVNSIDPFKAFIPLCLKAIEYLKAEGFIITYMIITTEEFIIILLPLKPTYSTIKHIITTIRGFIVRLIVEKFIRVLHLNYHILIGHFI